MAFSVCYDSTGLNKRTMNFEIFKAELKRIMDFKDSFNEEYFHDWYIEFKESIYLDEREFARFWFADVSFKTHDYQLSK